MALPKISLPTFRVVIPSRQKEVTMRPMTVKEEKILLMAKTNEDNPDADIIRALVQVIGNCILDEVDVGNLTYFDIEWLFLKLREQSVSNIVKLNYEDTEINVDLGKVEIPTVSEENGIELPGNLLLTMRYPPVKIYFSTDYVEASEEERFNIVLRYSLDSIWEEDKKHDPKNSPPEEINEFIESIPSKQFEKINEFFSGQPTLKYTVEYTNKEKEKKSIELRGLSDFFMF